MQSGGNPLQGRFRCSLPWENLSDDPGFLSGVLAELKHVLNPLVWNNQTEAHSEIEGVPHLPFRDVSMVLKPIKHFKAVETGRTDGCAGPRGETAGQILRQPPSGDVGHAVNLDAGIQNPTHQRRIKPCRRQKIVNQRPVVLPVTRRRIGT